MSIKQESEAYKAQVEAKLGANFAILSGDIGRVQASEIREHVLKLGQTAPEFELPDAFGKGVSLKSLLSKGPVVISFYRGEWCPFCNIELRGLQEALPKIQNLGATLVAISPENPDHSIIAIEKNKLTFPVLTDHGNKVARLFGVVFRIGKEVEEFSKNVFKNDLAVRNGEDSYELPIPATFVIDQTGKICFVHADADYMTGRVEPETLLEVLNSIHQPTAK